MVAVSPTYKIKDDGFDINFISKYSLYLHLHINHLNVCVFDTEENKCLLFESYNFEEVESEASLMDCLKGIWENNHLLNAGFWHKVVAINVSQDFVFIPHEHFNEDAAINYLRLNCNFNDNFQSIHSTKQYELDTVCVFTVHKELENWLNNQYSSTPVQYIHFNSSFLHGLLTMNVEELAVIIHSDIMTIAHLENKQLKFVNSFPYSHSNDILYFILFVMDEIGIAHESGSVKLWGTQDLGDIASMLQNYIRTVEIGERPPLKYGIGFDDTVDEYFAYDLFATYYLMR